MSELVDQLTPPSLDFHKPPPGDPIQITSTSKGSKAMQLTLPFPLFLPFDKTIGVLIGPNAIQLLLELALLFSYFACSFNHSVYSFPLGISFPFEVL